MEMTCYTYIICQLRTKFQIVHPQNTFFFKCLVARRIWVEFELL